MNLSFSVSFHFLICTYFLVWYGSASEHPAIKPKLAILNNVLMFCEANGKKFVTVTSYSERRDNSTIIYPISTLFTLTKQRKLYTRYLRVEEARSHINMPKIDSTIILVNYQIIENNDTSVINDIIRVISRTKIRSSILVISTNVGAGRNIKIKIDAIISALSECQQNMFFYVVHDYVMKNGSIGFLWNQLITLQNNPKVISNSIVFDSEYKIVER